MRFSIVLGQRLPWSQMLANAIETETLGFDGFYLVDHFFGRLDIDEPTHEGYTMLAALAPFTQNLRLGLMVAGNTYRNPAFLLKQAITVDHISNGRVDFGVGAGWAEREHEAFGFDFPSAKERVDRFAEALVLWDRLQTEDHISHEGQFYQLLDAPFEPKSLQGKLPVLIGGSKPRMLRLTARYADIWNCTGTPEVGADLNRQLDEACIAEGRDPAEIARAVSPELNLLESVEAFASGVSAYQAAGFTEVCMPWPRMPAEIPVIRVVACDIMPSFRSTAGATRSRPISPTLRPLTAEDMAQFSGPRTNDDWRPLIYLIANPDRLIDGHEIRTALGYFTHAEVTRAFGRLAHVFESMGIERPWQEGPRGRTLTHGFAQILDLAG